MYTTQVSIYDTPSFKVVSYGNGAAYKFHNKTINKSCWFADADAEEFRGEIEGWEESRADLNSEQILTEIWSYYDEVSI
jgi:hypothetical protein